MGADERKMPKMERTLFPKLAQPLAEPKKAGEVSLGTSIMAVVYDGGVVMAADSRTSTGQYVANRVSDKLSSVAERIYCCRSGSAADTQAISDIVAYYLDLHAIELGSKPQVKTAASLFQELCYSNKDRLMAGIIVGGWDPINGGSLYSISLGGSLVKQPFAIGGSGSTYIYALCDHLFKNPDGSEPKMTKAETQKFVKLALSHAMARDGSSGGIIRMVTISEAGVEKEYVPNEALPYKSENGI